MRRHLLSLTAIAVTVALAACGGKPAGAEFTKEDTAAIRQLVQDFVTAYNAKDVAKLQSLFSGTASVMPANRNTLSGVDGVKAFFQERLTTEGAGDVNVDITAIEGQGTLGYVTGKFSLILNPAGAPEPRRDRGKVLWIVRKLGGRWLFEVQIMSSDLPAVAPAPPAAPAPPSAPKAKK
ncbi:MAG: DUF4440 domain-containing protein [Bacteroidales bacterium]